MKKITIFFALLGIAALTAITAWLGVGHVLNAMRRIGYDGFALLVLGQALVNCLLGLAWWATCPFLGAGRTIAARFIRDAAGNCLPFSQLGGMIAGIRATCFDFTSHRRRVVEWPEAVATNLADITAEVIGQIAFILIALLCLIGHQDGARFTWPLLGGMGLLSLGIAGFVYTQHRGGAAIRWLAQFFGKHIAESWRDSLVDNIGAFQSEMDRIWSRPGRVARGTFVHLLGWLSSAALTLMAFRFLGASLSYLDAVAIEGVVCGVMSAGFLVPASLGVQEGAYVALGVIFGIAPDVALGISLLRRGRDLTIGIPVLLVWQALEMRRLQHPAAEDRSVAPPSRASS